MKDKIEEILIEEKFDGTWQVLPVHSVGIKGDKRIYGKVIELIPKSKWDYEIITNVSKRLCNEIEDVCRVTIRI